MNRIAITKKAKFYKDINNINIKMIPSDLKGLLDEFFSNKEEFS